MPHEKFQPTGLTGSLEEGFICPGGHIGLPTMFIFIDFHSPFARRLHMKFA